MNHITEEQIEWIYTRYDGDMINCANAVARQAVVSYVDQQAKELPVLPEPNYRLSPDSEPSLYDPYDMQAYGAACAAHAREVAISETVSIAYGYADNLTWNDSFKAEIKALKGK